MPVSILLPDIVSEDDVFKNKTQYQAVDIRPVYTREYTQDPLTGKYVTDDSKKEASYKLFIQFFNTTPIIIEKDYGNIEINNPEVRAKAKVVSRFPKNLY
jgi:hypothetical protein